MKDLLRSTPRSSSPIPLAMHNQNRGPRKWKLRETCCMAVDFCDDVKGTELTPNSVRPDPPRKDARSEAEEVGKACSCTFLRPK